MRKTHWIPAAAAVVALVSSCVVSDQLTTLTVAPDGSADLVRVQSNIRSTEKGARGAEEMRRFIEEFDAQKDSDAVRAVAAGGVIVDARWLRREEPCSNLLVARFPDAAALERFCTLKDDKGETVVSTTFKRDGKRRKLLVSARVPREEKVADAAPPTDLQMRQAQANGISETRVVVAAGEIVAARGFTVADDKRSALLEPAAVEALLRAGKGQIELFLEWEVAAK